MSFAGSAIRSGPVPFPRGIPNDTDRPPPRRRQPGRLRPHRRLPRRSGNGSPRSGGRRRPCRADPEAGAGRMEHGRHDAHIRLRRVRRRHGGHAGGGADARRNAPARHRLRRARQADDLPPGQGRRLAFAGQKTAAGAGNGRLPARGFPRRRHHHRRRHRRPFLRRSDAAPAPAARGLRQDAAGRREMGDPVLPDRGQAPLRLARIHARLFPPLVQPRIHQAPARRHGAA